MHQWLNPLLQCRPVEKWSTNVGAESLFIIKIPIFQPTLKSVVIERKKGLIIWQFQGFFQGCDHWECIEKGEKTLLINTFSFKIDNPLVQFGFNIFAAKITKKDMESQLKRLKNIAENL